MTAKPQSPIFDYKTLRLLIGVIALMLPWVVTFLSDKPLSSISASYHTDARDMFVGALFVVAAFLLAYNGHDPKQRTVAKFAAAAAVLVAIYPTACDTCKIGGVSWVHFGAAVTLFAILGYFCLGPFRWDTRKHPRWSKRWRRDWIYRVCGWTIFAALALAVLLWLVLPRDTFKSWQILYWVEIVALEAFGIAWITAGKILPVLVDKKQALIPGLVKE